MAFIAWTRRNPQIVRTKEKKENPIAMNVFCMPTSSLNNISNPHKYPPPLFSPSIKDKRKRGIEKMRKQPKGIDADQYVIHLIATASLRAWCSAASSTCPSHPRRRPHHSHSPSLPAASAGAH